jgi:uncharacterized membrane protein
LLKVFRRYLITGVIIWVPLVVTLLVARFLIKLMDRSLVLIPPAYRPEELLGFGIPGLGVLLTIGVLLLTGMLGANFAGRRFVSFWESLLSRKYPRKGVWSLCFQTSTDLAEIQGRTDEEVICVFVPTTPNPTSGFILFVPRGELVQLDMSVDEGLKMIISLGVVVPRWRDPEAAGRLAPPEGGT